MAAASVPTAAHTPVDLTISSTATDMSLPFRAKCVEESDRKYADVVREEFVKIPEEERKIFNEFTKDLMTASHINRYHLLEAIDSYEARHGSPGSWEWQSFSDTAFNYRPYQPW